MSDLPNNANRDTCGCGAAHVHGELVRDLWRVHDLLNIPAVAELGIGVVHGVLVILGR